jgi:DNA-binding NarL/FixJ family response regulator
LVFAPKGGTVKNILLIDDNSIFRRGLRELVREAQPQLGILEAETFTAGRAILRESGGISAVILDIKVPDCGGFVGLFQLKSEFPNIPAIVLSSSSDPDSVSRAMAFGASGFIGKSAPCEEIARTLKSILLERSWTGVPIVACEKQINPIAALSPAQLRVLKGLQRGLRNKQIAFELGLTEKTVKAYMSVLYRRLGVSTRTQALILVQEVPL